MTTWLLAHDFSPCARAAALEAAQDLTGRNERKLILLHVVSIPRLPEGYDHASFLTALEKDAQYQLDASAQEIHKIDPELEVEFLVREGEPSQTILLAAQENKVSRIVLGTHSRTEVDAFFIGSVAQRVMRHASVPVLVVKSTVFTPAALKAAEQD